METLSDFGTVDFFNVSTLTTGIYNAWISFDDLSLANRLSFFLLIFILGLFVLENFSRKKAQYHSPTKSGFKSKTLIKLDRSKSTLAIIFCSFIFFASFMFPVLQMLYWTIIFPKHFNDLNIVSLFINTGILVLLASTVLITFAFISNYGNRVTKSKLLEALTTFSISGYAIPGSNFSCCVYKLLWPGLIILLFNISDLKLSKLYLLAQF